MLRVEDDLAAHPHAVDDRLLDHGEVFVVRRLQHGRHLPGVALAHERPHRSLAFDQRLSVSRRVAF